MLGKIEMKGGFQVLTFVHASAPSGVISAKPMSMQQFYIIVERASSFEYSASAKFALFLSAIVFTFSRASYREIRSRSHSKFQGIVSLVYK